MHCVTVSWQAECNTSVGGLATKMPEQYYFKYKTERITGWRCSHFTAYRWFIDRETCKQKRTESNFIAYFQVIFGKPTRKPSQHVIDSCIDSSVWRHRRKQNKNDLHIAPRCSNCVRSRTTVEKTSTQLNIRNIAACFLGHRISRFSHPTLYSAWSS